MVFVGQGVNGFSGRFYNNLKAGGSPAKFTTDKFIDFHWDQDTPYPEIDSTAFSASWDATLIPPHGPVKVKLIHNDGCRLYLDGRLIIDAWEDGPVRIDSTWINIEKGKSYNIQIDYYTRGGPSMLKFGFEYIREFLFKEAVDKAGRADVAVVFIGQPLLFEADGTIERDYNIPEQSDLIEAILEVNPRTIAILRTDSAVDIERWAFNVPAIIQAWPPGESDNREIAELLMGAVYPYGKLPFRWAMNENQNFDTRFPRGYGMNYTIIGIGKLLMNRMRIGSGWTATVETSNVGGRAGTETLQLLVVDPDGTNMGLKAKKKVTLFPGEKKTIAISVPYEAFEVTAEDGTRTIRPGKYEILVGTSEEDIKLRKTIELKEKHIRQYMGYD
jgi:beta-glucosidase